MKTAQDQSPSAAPSAKDERPASLRQRLALLFSSFARRLCLWAGRPAAFFAALALIIIWLASGPPFDYSDTWQLIVNTATTVITFLMVFLIQHTQYRDTEEIHIKLNELIRATQGAHNTMVALERWSDEEIEAALRHYRALAAEAERRTPKVARADAARDPLPPEAKSEPSARRS
jgi:low affinity Fe/Cu permease